MLRANNLWLLTLVAAGCGAGGVQFDPDVNPLTLYEVSLESYRHGDCNRAVLGFQRLTFELAQGEPKQAEARYYIAECTLKDRDFLEAARQFRRVADEYPRHPLAPDALLRAADAYTELWKGPQLDPSYGETALATYRELSGRYATSTAAERARLRIAELNELFAEKEYTAGRFYMRLRAFDSAIIYFKDVVAQYPRSSFASKAVLRLIEAYTKIGYEEEKQEMCGYLLRYYPDTDGGADACPDAANDRG